MDREATPPQLECYADWLKGQGRTGRTAPGVGGPGACYVWLSGQPEAELVPRKAMEFRAKLLSSLTLTFVKDDTDEVVDVIVSQRDSTLHAARR
jgi:hypothetical protein